MSSIRKKLTVNENDSKNTRMDLASAGVLGNWRPDELAHMSRFDKIASLAIDEAKVLGRPLDTLEVGCGECWALRCLYKAYVVKKSDIIRSYYGYDIDPACELENKFWSNSGGRLEESTWFKNFNGQIRIQDLTVNPVFDLPDESIDFFWSTEVIEHMGKEFIAAWLDDAARVMRPNGLAFVSTPNHDGSNDKLPEDHVYEWGFQELKEELETCKLSTDKIVNQKKYVDVLREVLSDKGARGHIIKKYVPIINNLINEHLQAMDFFVSFHLDEEFNETVKSRHRDTFNYNSFSEGEKLRIDLAILFTWRTIAKMKNSVNTNLLILDEIFDSSLDQQGTDDFFKIVNKLRNENVFIISHKGDILFDKFTNILKFEKYQNFTRLQNT